LHILGGGGKDWIFGKFLQFSGQISTLKNFFVGQKR